MTEEHQETDTVQEPSQSVGLARFHKATISMGVIFLGLMIWRYWRQYQIHDSPRYLIYGGAALVLMVGLTAYLLSFNKKQL